MGNFFKAIASAFVEVQEDVDAQVAVTTPPQTVTPQPTNNSVVQTQVTPTPQITSPDGKIQGQLDNQLFEQLCDVIEESNLPGPDYVELKKAADNDAMKTAIPDENARLMTAYISMKAAAPQLNRSVVLGSIDTYIGILEKERGNGLEQLKQKWVENVENPEKAVEAAQQEIVELQQKLQERIKFVSEQKGAVANAKNEYNICKANFNYTFDIFVQKLKDDRVKLDTLLQD